MSRHIFGRKVLVHAKMKWFMTVSTTDKKADWFNLKEPWIQTRRSVSSDSGLAPHWLTSLYPPTM